MLHQIHNKIKNVSKIYHKFLKQKTLNKKILIQAWLISKRSYKKNHLIKIATKNRISHKILIKLVFLKQVNSPIVRRQTEQKKVAHFILKNQMFGKKIKYNLKIINQLKPFLIDT